MSVAVNKNSVADISQQLNNTKNSANDFKSDLDGNIKKFKDKMDYYSRKEISTKVLDDFTRMIYTNPNHLVKVEFVQYIMLVSLIYFYNPLPINTKFPILTKLLVLIIAFLYVILFIFIKMKVEAAEDVDLIGPTETTIIMQFVVTIVFFFLFMLAIKGILWILINTNVLNIFRHMMTLFIIMGVLGIVY